MTSALLEAVLASSASSPPMASVEDTDLCWIVPVMGNPPHASLLDRYIDVTKAIDPANSRYSDWIRADGIVLAQLRRQQAKSRFGLRLPPGETVASRQSTLLSNVTLAGVNPHRRPFALELLRILVAGPDWPVGGMGKAFSDGLARVLSDWRTRPDPQITPSHNTPAAAASSIDFEAQESLQNEAALLLVEHGVPLDSETVDMLLRTGQLAFLLRFLSRWSPARCVSFISSARLDQTVSQAPQPYLYMRSMMHCQRILQTPSEASGQLEPSQTAETLFPGSPPVATVLALQSWLRAAASEVASHPAVVCADELLREVFHLDSTQRASLQSAVAHLCWPDLALLGDANRTLLATLYWSTPEWVSLALVERMHVLMADAKGSSNSSSCPALSVLYNDALLSSLLPTVIEAAILSLMTAPLDDHIPAFEELLRRLLRFARDREIPLWPLNLITVAPDDLRCYPWALLTRTHLTSELFCRGRALPVARLLHECGVESLDVTRFHPHCIVRVVGSGGGTSGEHDRTAGDFTTAGRDARGRCVSMVGERGESWTHHLCAEGTLADLKQWLSCCPEFALTAGWLLEPAESFAAPRRAWVPGFPPVLTPNVPAQRLQQALHPRLLREKQIAAWTRNRTACQRVMALANQWMRSVGACRVRRALLPHLIPDLHAIVIDYLMAEGQSLLVSTPRLRQSPAQMLRRPFRPSPPSASSPMLVLRRPHS